MAGFKFKKEEESNERLELQKMEDFLDEMIMERDEKYKSTVHDFAYPDHKTEIVMKALKNMTSKIKGQQTRIDKKKLEMGWNPDQVARTRKEKPSR